MKSLKIPGFAPSQPLGYYVSKKLFSKYSQNAIIFLKNPWIINCALKYSHQRLCVVESQELQK